MWGDANQLLEFLINICIFSYILTLPFVLYLLLLNLSIKNEKKIIEKNKAGLQSKIKTIIS